jgi:hypothetical protein
MESHQLLKLCRECGLLDCTRCRKADIDLVFHRARAETIYARVQLKHPVQEPAAAAL